MFKLSGLVEMTIGEEMIELKWTVIHNLWTTNSTE